MLNSVNQSATPLVIEIFPCSKERIMFRIILGLCGLISASGPSIKASPIGQDIWLVDVLGRPFNLRSELPRIRVVVPRGVRDLSFLQHVHASSGPHHVSIAMAIFP